METEKAALRNSAVVATLFSVTAVIRKLKKRKQGGAKRKPWGLPPLEPLGTLEEAYKSALGVGGTTEVYGLLKKLLGRHVAALGSLVPLRLSMNDPRLRLNYKFLVAFAVGQAIIELVPFFRKNTTLVMLLSTAQLLASWLYSDTALPRDYNAFLYDHGQISRERLLEFRELTFGEGLNKDYKPYCFPKREGGQWEFDEHKPLEVLRAVFMYFTNHLKSSSIPFYIKVYSLRLLFFLLIGKKNTQVHTRLSGMVKDVLRSSCFLAGYCTMAYVAVFSLVATMPERRSHPLLLWAALGSAGLPLLVETPSQQRTISAYCATFGVYPALEYLGAFDYAAVAVSLLASTGTVRTSIPFRLMWGDDASADKKKIKK